MSDELRPGHYKDGAGNWQRDRRKGGERRRDGRSVDHERRVMGRRIEDRLVEQEHKAMIDEALEDFNSGEARSADESA